MIPRLEKPFCRRGFLTLASDLFKTAATLPATSLSMEQKRHCLRFFLALALIFDIVGIVLFILGIFAPWAFWDFFVLSGPLLIFLSLVFWIFWYMGGLTVPYEELIMTKSDMRPRVTLD